MARRKKTVAVPLTAEDHATLKRMAERLPHLSMSSIAGTVLHDALPGAPKLFAAELQAAVEETKPRD